MPENGSVSERMAKARAAGAFNDSVRELGDKFSSMAIAETLTRAAEKILGKSDVSRTGHRIGELLDTASTKGGVFVADGDIHDRKTTIELVAGGERKTIEVNDIISNVGEEAWYDIIERK